MLIIKYFLVIGALLTAGLFGVSTYLERQADHARAAAVAFAAAAAAREAEMPKPQPVSMEKPEEDDLVIEPKAPAGKVKTSARHRRRSRD